MVIFHRLLSSTGLFQESICLNSTSDLVEEAHNALCPSNPTFLLGLSHTEDHVDNAFWRSDTTLVFWKDIFCHGKESIQKYLHEDLGNSRNTWNGDVTIFSTEWAVSFFEDRHNIGILKVVSVCFIFPDFLYQEHYPGLQFVANMEERFPVHTVGPESLSGFHEAEWFFQFRKG